MIFPLRPYRLQAPAPSLGGSIVRYKPVIPLTVIGPSGQVTHPALVDSGADDVVLLVVSYGVHEYAAAFCHLGHCGRPGTFSHHAGRANPRNHPAAQACSAGGECSLKLWQSHLAIWNVPNDSSVHFLEK